VRPKSILFTLLFVCFTTVFATAQKYTITDLGPLAPTGINSLAQVVGNYDNQAYIWSFGRMKALGLLPGGTFSQASGINDFGAVTGTADGPGTVVSPDPTLPNQQCADLTQPFLWTAKTGIQGLGTEGWDPYFQFGGECMSFFSEGINNSSQVVGEMPSGPDLYAWGFTWTSANGFSLFGGSWSPTFVNGISNKAQIVGQNAESYDISYATSWQNGVATNLGALNSSGDSATSSSSANDVNNTGQIVGWSTISPISVGACYDFFDPTDCIIHAVLWTPGAVISDLGTLPGDQYSIALKINSSGQVIGSSGNTLQEPFQLQVIGRPFIWSARNGIQDLNTLIHSNSGWVLNSAADINVWGQIVGNGTLNGQSHGYLLTPNDPFSKTNVKVGTDFGSSRRESSLRIPE
jgi:uncharacterized membrane protein